MPNKSLKLLNFEQTELHFVLIAILFSPSFQCIFSSFHISSLKVDHQGKLHAINPDHHHPSDPWFCPLSQDSSCIGFPTSITNKKSAAR